jgi:hypothetical protein
MNLFPFLAALAFIAISCSSSKSTDKGVEFTPATLGLTPGKTTAEVNFAWYSTEGEKSLVRIFNGDSLVAMEIGISGSAGGKNIYHKVSAKNLMPNTQYAYRVSNDSINWSKKYTYKTPPTGDFKFAIVGDPQLTNDDFSDTEKNWAEVMKKIAQANASFIVSAGDQVDPLTNNEDAWTLFFAPGGLRNIPLAPTTGNHDSWECSMVHHFNLPNEVNAPPACNGRADVEKAGNYYYLYNNILFIALNTSYYPTSASDAAPYITQFEKTIQTAKNANTGKYKWLVVHHHKSTQSIAIHAADTDIQYYVEAGFEKLMAKYGVNLVIAGHDHIYVRSHPIEGTVYLTLTTASGLKFYQPLDAKNLPSGVNVYAQKEKPEYTIVEVSESAMALKTYAIDGSITDEFTLAPP